MKSVVKLVLKMAKTLPVPKLPAELGHCVSISFQSVLHIEPFSH